MIRRFVLLIILGVLLGLFWATADESQPASEAETEARVEAISKTLRCVVCQNQSIYDSNAPLAEDMRTLVEKRVRAGDSDDEVRAYLRERYGDYVLMSPPFQANTLILWIAPIVLGLLGALWFAIRVFRRSAPPVPEAGLSSEDQARIDAALKGNVSPGTGENA